MKKMEEKLIDFLLYLNEKKLINNYDFSYEEEAKQFLLCDVAGQSEQFYCTCSSQKQAGTKPCTINGVISPLSMQEVLYYEIHSHWLASWIGFEWGQNLMGKYFAWKVRRKYNRYLVSLEERKRVLNGL